MYVEYSLNLETPIIIDRFIAPIIIIVYKEYQVSIRDRISRLNEAYLWLSLKFFSYSLKNVCQIGLLVFLCQALDKSDFSISKLNSVNLVNINNILVEFFHGQNLHENNYAMIN